ncbi:uncharacterized protein [Henckelia pumila]|uniref:uncharacterized protein n=1 Tax=Henckelia pumila TaxID=405737 RepID=UPI003C6DED37
MTSIQEHDNYFMERADALGRPGLSIYQKITAATRILTYDVGADATDEYIKIGESTVTECVKRFFRAVVEVFDDLYLRSPNALDIERLLYIGKQRGFLGMLGSLVCMHWKWKNCPTAWVGQYTGRSESPKIIFEVVADYDMWIYHAYFGFPDSDNDINVLSKSHLFANLFIGWATIVQTIHNPQGPKNKYFATRQESCRKDVERAFGLLQSKWAIITGPARVWSKHILHDIMTMCIIMHNMIIEDERDEQMSITNYREAPIPEVEMVHDEHVRFQEFIARHRQIKDKSAHYALRDALIDHLWEKYFNSEY